MPNNEKAEAAQAFYYGAKGITVTPQTNEGSLHIYLDGDDMYTVLMRKNVDGDLKWVTASKFYPEKDNPDSVVNEILEDLDYLTGREYSVAYYSEALGLTNFPQREDGAVRLERADATVSDGSYRFDVSPYRNGGFKSDAGDHFYSTSRSFRDAVEEYKALGPVSTRKPKTAIQR